MRDSEVVAAPALPPGAQLVQMFAGSWVAVAVYTAAKLGIADHLATEREPPPSWRRSWARTRRRCIGSCGRSPASASSAEGDSDTLRADTAWRGAADGRARRGAFDAARLLAGRDSGARGRRSSIRWKPGSRVREDLGHAALRLSRQHPEAASHVQRARWSAFTAPSRRPSPEAYDFSGIADGRRCRRRHRQHAGSGALASSRPAGRALRPAAVVRDAPALLKAHGVEPRSRSSPGTSSSACLPAVTLICCRTSSTTGAKAHCLTILDIAAHLRQWPASDRRDRPARRRYASPGQTARSRHAGLSGGPERTEADMRRFSARPGSACAAWCRPHR